MKVNLETITPESKGSTVIFKIDIKGSLDSNNSSDFDYIISTLFNGGARKLLVDIDDLQYIDSTGISTLISITKKLRKDNGDIAIVRYTSQIMAILKPINIEKFIQFFPTINEGITFLKTIDN